MPKNQTTTFVTGAFCPGVLRTHQHRPLLVGCSGGAGHISAITGIRNYLDCENLLVTKPQMPSYRTQPVVNRRNIKGTNLIEIASFLSNGIPILSEQFRKLLAVMKTPNLPAHISEEVNRLLDEQIRSQGRHYIDMLLDIYPAGYEHAAIWNILQREDKVGDIQLMLPLRGKIDKQHYKFVYKFFENKLTNAHDFNVPYTEIISTQILGIAALCDAVIAHNEKYGSLVQVHQYITDMPTEYASHFFESLEQLTPQQRQVIFLYGVNLEENWPKVCERYSNLGESAFGKVVTIDPHNNPMVRPGFKKGSLAEFVKTQKCELEVQMPVRQCPVKYAVAPEEKIACIMLGSQASNDIVKYVSQLVDYGRYKKIFIFGGATERIQGVIKEAVKDVQTDVELIYLANQDDDHIAPIMARSNLIITRTGGISCFEQMALVHRIPDQYVYLHAKSDAKGVMSTGIEWEDGNRSALASYLEGQANRANVRSTSDVRFKYNLTKLAQLTGHTDYVPPTYDALLQNLGPSDLLKQLILDVEELPEDDEHEKGFKASLYTLHASLDNHHENMSDKEKFSNKSNVAKVARETIKMIADWKDHRNHDKSERLNVLQRYKNACKQSSGLETFAKVIATVLITGLGCIIGAGIGLAAGVSVGGVVGPVASITGLIGLVKGLTLGGKIGFFAAAGVTGLGVGSFEGYRMFKASKLQKCIKQVSEVGKESSNDFNVRAGVV